MTTNQFTKFAVGDLVYKHPSTKKREGDAGIVVRVMIGQEGDEIWLKQLPEANVKYLVPQCSGLTISNADS